MIRLTPFLFVVIIASGCASELGLPAAPSSAASPVVVDLAPSEAFGGDVVEVVGAGFDPVPGNNEVRFAGGLTARGFACTERGFRVRVPQMQYETGPVTVTTPAGTSAASPTSFVPLGYGYPIVGASVTQLRLRHRPVGIVDSYTSVVIASQLFGQLVMDAGRTEPLDGLPLAFVRTAADEAVVSVAGAQGGRVMLADAETGRALAASAWDAIKESFVLPGDDGAAFTTLGVDENGGWIRTVWRRESTELKPTRTVISGGDVLGAARASDGRLFVVARIGEGTQRRNVLARIDGEAFVPVWSREGAMDDKWLTGAVAVVDSAEGPVAAMALSDGNFEFYGLASGTAHEELAVSFDPAFAIVPGSIPGKVIAAKRADSSVFQYDCLTGHLDWSAWVSGGPAALDVFGEEVVVANENENVVDVFSTVNGTARGRISFALGLGAAGGREGGIVAPYTYSQGPSAAGAEPVMNVLARWGGFVVQVDPDSLEVLRVVPLAREASEPLRLLVAPGWRTLVMHAHEIGMLPGEGRPETLLVPSLRSPPVEVVFLGTELLVVGSALGLDVFRWDGATLVLVHTIDAAPGASLEGLGADGDQLAAVWRAPGGWRIDRYDVATVTGQGGAPSSIALAAGYGDYMGLIDLASESRAPLRDPVCEASEPWTGRELRPAIAFGRSPEGGPALLTDLTRAELPTPQSIDVARRGFAGTTPNHRFAVWLDEATGDSVVRVLQHRTSSESPTPGLARYASFRVPARAAAPGFDPSGAWMFVPIPSLDVVAVYE